MSDLGERVAARIKTQIGVTELTGNNDGTPAIRYNRGEKKAWCMSLAAWAYAEEGVPLPGKSWMWPSVQYCEDQLRAKGMLIERDSSGEWSKMPEVGDIILFKNRGDSDKGGGRHAGIVIGVDPKTKRVFTTEGNVGNKVGNRSYKWTDPRISSFGRPTK